MRQEQTGWLKETIFHVAVMLLSTFHTVSTITLFDIVGLSSLEEFCGVFYPTETCDCKRFYLTYKRHNYSLCDLLNGTVTTAAPNVLTTKSNTVKQSKYELTDLQTAQITLTIFAAVLGIVGNSMVVAVYVRKKERRNHHMSLITVLACTDILFAISSLTTTVPEILTHQWVYGEGMCKLLYSMYTLGSLVAIGIILIIALERYIGIVHPFTKGLTSRTGNILLVANLVLAVICVLPRSIVLQLNEFDVCMEIWPHSEVDSLIYSGFLLAIYSLMPIAVICFLYWRIIIALKNGFARFNTISESELDRRQREKKLSENKRIMRILISVLLAFVVLTLPSKIYWILINSKTDFKPQDHQGILFFTATAYPFHVAVNPIIYSLIDHKFREAVIDILKCYRYKKTFHTSNAGATVVPMHNVAFKNDEVFE